MPTTWDGKGEPPGKTVAAKRAAATAWMISQGVPREVAEHWHSLGGGFKGSWGDHYRAKVRRFKEDPAYRQELIDNAPSASEQSELDEANAERKSRESFERADKNRDGKVTKAEAEVERVERDSDAAVASTPDEFERYFGEGPQAAQDRGLPLLPFEGTIPEDFSVENRSKTNWLLETAKNRGAGDASSAGKDRVGIRYFDTDTLVPLKWSEERRAELQRALYDLGLYGNEKIRLGVWGARDQAAFAEILQAANVEGRTWADQLTHWQRVPPLDLIEEISGSMGRTRPTIRLTNPVDIRRSARDTAARSMGFSDPEFTASAVADYQAMERAEQQRIINDQEAGGGGEVANAPSLDAYMQERFERERPVQTVAGRVLGGLNLIAQRLGLAG